MPCTTTMTHGTQLSWENWAQVFHVFNKQGIKHPDGLLEMWLMCMRIQVSLNIWLNRNLIQRMKYHETAGNVDQITPERGLSHTPLWDTVHLVLNISNYVIIKTECLTDWKKTKYFVTEAEEPKQQLRCMYEELLNQRCIKSLWFLMEFCIQFS